MNSNDFPESISSVLDHNIEEVAQSEGIKDYELPTYEEYKSFFEDNSIDTESVDIVAYIDISFEDGKVILEYLGDSDDEENNL